MKEKMTIGEFAKLKNITAETLRHYDRYDLLKPEYIDEKTGYRFYSIFQFEKLSTILELRQLGMNLSEIKDFFDNRNAENSLKLLEERYEKLLEEIEKLEYLKDSISYKISHLKTFLNSEYLNQNDFKNIPERKALLWKKGLNSGMEVEYGYAELEQYLKEFAPIFAENRYGLRRTLNESNDWNSYLILFVDENLPLSDYSIVDIIKIPGGLYATTLCQGTENDVIQHIKNMKNELESKGYKISGDIIQIVQIDLSVTGTVESLLYEIQIPIKSL